jgi:F-box and WD-40 domain protein CDC4
VWKQRLMDDNLWQGLGTEEEEEQMMTQRMGTLLRWKGSYQAKGSTPSEDEIMDLPSAGPLQTHSLESEQQQSDPPVPLKHVYRRRYTAEQNWLCRTPTHRSFPGQGMNVVTCTQFDREKIITASDDHSINVYDIKQGTLKRRLDGHEGGVWALEYRGDTLVTGSTDRTVRVWDLETYEEVHSFHGHSSTVRCLQIVEPVLDAQTGEYVPPYPMFVTGSRDSTLRVWKLPKKGEARCNTKVSP